MKIWFVSFIIFISNLCLGQSSVQVSILDANNTNAISSATIIYQSQGKEKFTSTNQSGKVILDNVDIPSTLVVKHWSYQTKTIQLDGTIKALVFELTPRFNNIEQVLIKSRPKTARITKDTVKFNIKSVLTASDKTSADVIKKLPMMDVDKDGNVSYRGMPIDRIVIDGNEFFGKVHKLSTENITVNMLDGIELIEKYTNIDGEKTKALNLKLKSQYKKRLSGALDVSGGFKNRFALHSNLFKFYENGNAALILDANNIAKSQLSAEDYKRLKDIQNNNTNVFQQEIESLYNFSQEDLNYRKENNDKLIALQLNKKMKKSQVYLFSVGNYTSFQTLVDKKVNYLEGGNDFSESLKKNIKNLLLTTQLKIKQNLGENSYIVSTTGYMPSRTTGDIYSENSQILSPISFPMVSQSHVFYQNLSFHSSFKNDSQLKADFSFSKQHNNYEFLIDKSPISIFSNDLTENNSLNKKILALSIQWDKNWDNGLFLKNNISMGNSNDSFNEFARKVQTYTVSSAFGKNIGQFWWNIGLETTNYSLYSENKLYINPNLEFKYNLNTAEKQNLTLTYRKQQTLPSVVNMLNFPIINNYREIFTQSFLPKNFIIDEHRLTLSYFYGDFSKQKFFWPYISLSIKPKTISSNIDFKEAISKVSYNLFPETKDFYSGINFDHTILKGKIKSKWDVVYTNSEYYSSIADVLNYQNISSFGIKNNLLSVFNKSKVNFSIYQKFQKIFAKNTLNNGFVQTSFEGTYTINYHLNKFSFNWNYYVNLLSIKNQAIQSFGMMNLEALYKVNEKFSLYARANNILNLNNFIIYSQQYNPLYTAFSEHTAQSGYVITGFNYNF
ncbi:hypothetical protein PG614_07370 [Riemerella anatipestifer]|nr:hypothetical protein [Riemerella anatipestifer]MDY3534111.1 hypothetical protein [Riemerella anatipestifer]MDY3535766.1 hypothetical protein [Riemerella anatipestifer]